MEGGVMFRAIAISLYWWSRIRPAQIQAQVRGVMFRAMAIRRLLYYVVAILHIEWCTRKPWSSSIILCNNNIFAHNIILITTLTSFILQPYSKIN